MKKRIIFAFIGLAALSQACGGSDPVPTPLARIKGKWTETKTITNVNITKATPAIALVLLGNSGFSTDTIRPIRVFNFLNEKDVEVTLQQGGQQQTTKGTWKFIDNNQSIEFAGINNAPMLGGTAALPSTFLVKILNPNYSNTLQIESKQTIQGLRLQNIPTLGTVTIDADLKFTIDLKKE